MPEEDPVAKFRRELKNRFRLAGKGSVSRVQRRLGVGKGFFKNIWRKQRQSFDLRMFLRTLGVMEVDLPAFFVTVFGPADPVMAFCAEARRLGQERGQRPTILARESARETASHQTASRETLDLAGLDEMRYENPRKVIRRVGQLISVVADEDIPLLLGAHASACRVAGRLDEAQIVLGRALELAGDDRSIAVGLIQRSSYVAADRGQFQNALELAERATLDYSRLGDRLGLGKSLVEQGNWLFCLERFALALSTYQAALKLFAGEGTAAIRRYRFSGLMNSGIIHRKLGQLDKAEHFGLAAREQADGVGRVMQGNLLAFQASIARDRGKYDQATTYFREAIEAQAETSPLDTAFSVIQLCRLQLSQNLSSQAHETAKVLLPLLEKLEDNPLASSYVTEILRCAVAGRGLTAELLHRVARGLQEVRTKTRRAR